MNKSFNSFGKLVNWVCLFVSFWYYLHATEWRVIEEETDNETLRIAYIFFASVAAICALFLAPRTGFYDVVRYILLAILWADSYHFNGDTTLTRFFPVAAVLLLPSVINDFRGKGVRLTELPVSSVSKQPTGITSGAAGRSAVSYKDVLKQKGFNHIREVKTWFSETTYSALDKHGNEWVIVCKRENGKIKVKGKQKTSDTDDLDDLITLLVVLDDD